ncbi:MAG: hypothetical protein QGH39_12675 [Candidatus Thermoplasmatota archaeon]|jgi:hypothetical protein|nr:hypothetical protein [Candidatus Thermoplasmatota archaeon]MDP7266401.1 hypothetical protein [Candidatus Thermoplasmatota archaeon]
MEEKNDYKNENSAKRFLDIEKENKADPISISAGRNESVDITREKVNNESNDPPLSRGKKFINTLQNMKKRFPVAKIFFHNDMDGFASSLIAKELLNGLGFGIRAGDIFPLNHLMINEVKLDESNLYLFVDIKPPDPHPGTDQTGEESPPNVFCVDHHITNNPIHLNSPRFFLFSAHNEEDELPPTATSLMAYLLFGIVNPNLSYPDFIKHDFLKLSKRIRYLVLQATIADYLHLLSHDIGSNQLKFHTSSQGIDVDLVIKLSIATSLLLGKKDMQMGMFYDFYEEPLNNICENFFLDRFRERIAPVEVLFNFAEHIRIVFGQFSKEVFKGISEEKITLEATIKTDEDKLEMYLQANISIEMEDIVSSDMKEQKFYSQEIEKIRNRMAIDRKQLSKLAERLDKTCIKGVKGLALFIPRQPNEQTRGILSSLFYYEGWKNIVIEVSEQKSTWSSRGFNREELEKYLTIVSMDSQKFTDFRLADSATRKYPGLLSTPELSIITGYSGGMGGRGKIFGGIITGRAIPSLEKNTSARLETEEDFGIIPDSKFWDPAVQVIKTRFFKDDDWFSVQIGGGSESSNILKKHLDLLIVNLAGRNKTFRV